LRHAAAFVAAYSWQRPNLGNKLISVGKSSWRASSHEGFFAGPFIGDDRDLRVASAADSMVRRIDQ
jgi:hypothetical protein